MDGQELKVTGGTSKTRLSLWSRSMLISESGSSMKRIEPSGVPIYSGALGQRMTKFLKMRLAMVDGRSEESIPFSVAWICSPSICAVQMTRRDSPEEHRLRNSLSPCLDLC